MRCMAFARDSGDGIRSQVETLSVRERLITTSLEKACRHLHSTSELKKPECTRVLGTVCAGTRMSATLVEQLSVNTGHFGSNGLYHVQSWRPWMSMYGLRLRTQGPAQAEVQRRYLLLRLVTLCHVACLSLSDYGCLIAYTSGLICRCHRLQFRSCYRLN